MSRLKAAATPAPLRTVACAAVGVNRRGRPAVPPLWSRALPKSFQPARAPAEHEFLRTPGGCGASLGLPRLDREACAVTLLRTRVCAAAQSRTHGGTRISAPFPVRLTLRQKGTSSNHRNNHTSTKWGWLGVRSSTRMRAPGRYSARLYLVTTMRTAGLLTHS